MRVAAQVLVFYVLLVVVGGTWRMLPTAGLAPDIAALAAVYLGLTGQRSVAGSTAGAIAVGYLADVLFGAPRGSFAFAAGVMCLFCHVIGRRILIGGWVSAALITVCAAILGDIVVVLARGLPSQSIIELALGAVITAALGPLVFRLCRFVDARISHPEASSGIDIGDARC